MKTLKQPQVHKELEPNFSWPLTYLDRCDSCYQRAYVRVHLTSGNILTFCAHCYSKNSDTLFPLIEFIHDERSVLEEAEKHHKLF